MMVVRIGAWMLTLMNRLMVLGNRMKLRLMCHRLHVMFARSLLLTGWLSKHEIKEVMGEMHMNA